ncbi:MAG: putative RNA methyltransferase [Ktedonobacterales bacterium]
MLTCPVCEQPLARTDSGLRCPHGHSFDRARAGYVHLATSRQPGDTKAMLLARRAFLERGHYAPLAALIERLAVARYTALPAVEPPLAVLDVGCGEGYYVGGVRRALAAALPVPPLCFGLDVAKDAARLAAGRHPEVSFVVADVRARLPFASASVGLLLDVFAPRHPAEFARVVAPGGAALIVIPAPDHLAELRAALPLLAIEAEKDRHIAQRLGDAFILARTHTLDFALTLAAADLANLLAMTPNAWHATSEAAAAAGSLAPLAAGAAFRVLEFHRHAEMV